MLLGQAYRIVVCLCSPRSKHVLSWLVTWRLPLDGVFVVKRFWWVWVVSWQRWWPVLSWRLHYDVSDLFAVYFSEVALVRALCSSFANDAVDSSLHFVGEFVCYV